MYIGYIYDGLFVKSEIVGVEWFLYVARLSHNHIDSVVSYYPYMYTLLPYAHNIYTFIHIA